MANPFLELDERLSQLCLADVRISALMAELLGDDFVFVGSEWNRAGAPRFQQHMGDGEQQRRLRALGVAPEYCEHGW